MSIYLYFFQINCLLSKYWLLQLPRKIRNDILYKLIKTNYTYKIYCLLILLCKIRKEKYWDITEENFGLYVIYYVDKESLPHYKKMTEIPPEKISRSYSEKVLGNDWLVKGLVLYLVIFLVHTLYLINVPGISRKFIGFLRDV